MSVPTTILKRGSAVPRPQLHAVASAPLPAASGVRHRGIVTAVPLAQVALGPRTRPTAGRQRELIWVATLVAQACRVLLDVPQAYGDLSLNDLIVALEAHLHALKLDTAVNLNERTDERVWAIYVRVTCAACRRGRRYLDCDTTS